MTLDPQLVNAVFSGLVLLLGAVGTLVATRGRRVAVDRREHRRLQRAHLDALRHIFQLEQDLADIGEVPRPRPRSLDGGDEDNDPPAVLPPTPQPAVEERGRHGAP
ncbi:MAG: hypothetical protein EPO40_03060 [Myxococcaceae bacterium]|nr:MAG: hypothetical protein EPO40_03060 [Myxococcaceae bacterium]